MLSRLRQIKSSYYQLLLTTWLTFFLLSLTLLYISLSISFNHAMTKSVSKQSLQSLSQTSYSVEFMQQSAETVANQLFFNSTINQLLYATTYNDIDTIISLDTLTSYVESAIFVESVYIYSSRTGNVSYAKRNHGSDFESLDRFFDSDYLQVLNVDKDYRFKPIPRIIEGNKLVYSFVLAASRGSELSKTNSIVINISAEWLENTYKSISNQPDDKILIIDSNGIVVNGNAYAPVLTDLRQDPLIITLQEQQQKSGYFLNKVHGEEHLVTYTSSPNTGWSFILLTPYSAIQDTLTNMKLLIFAIYFLILLCGTPICLYITKKLYIPYSSLKNNLTDLEMKYKSNHMVNKQNTLYSLLINPSHLPATQLKHHVTAADIKVRFDQPFGLIHMQIDRFAEFSDLYNTRDRSLIKYCLQNISEEVIGRVTVTDSIDIDANCICILYNQSTDVETQLEHLIKDIQTYIRKEFKFTISVCVSEAGHALEDAPSMYQSAREGILNKFFSGPGSILYAREEAAKQLAAQVEYPLARQKQLTDLVMLGKIDAVKTLFSEILEDLNRVHYNLFTQVILTLTIELNITIQRLEKANELTIPFQFHAFITKINQSECYHDVLNLFFRLFDEIHEQLELKKNTKNEKLIQDIIQIIEQDYRDVNLSIETIADRVNLSSSHLRRLFKKATGSSIADHINKTRMEHAKNLLLHTKLSVASIADNVGYVNSTYFFTAFKKANGITPAEFRNKHIN